MRFMIPLLMAALPAASVAQSQSRTASGVPSVAILDCENPADHVFVDVHAECQGDLRSNSLRTPRAIAPFHFNDRIDQLFRRAFGTWPPDSFGGKQHSVLLREQHVMKMQQSGGF